MVKKTETGYKEEKGKLVFELDWEFIENMAERMALNKGKYEPYNWMKPINIEGLKQALFRHTIAIMKDEYSDEQYLGHIYAVACNAMILNYQLQNHNEN